jgi:hypothetical protein
VRAKCGACGRNVERLQQPGVRLHFCDISCKADWQRRQRPVSDGWLRQKYLVEGLDCVQIARLVDRHPKSVWFWLKGSGIPTRPRGGSTPSRKGGALTFAGRRHSAESIAKMRASAAGKYSGKKNPAWRGGCTPERQAFYSTKEWAEVSLHVWKRERGKCQRCGILKTVCTERPFHIHHIVSFRVVALRADASNLALLCDRCHMFVHSRANTTKEFIRQEKRWQSSTR